MAFDLNYVKSRIGDEIGLTEADLRTLYDIGEGNLDAHLATLGENEEQVVAHILATVDELRLRYRVLVMTESATGPIHNLLQNYLFHPLVSQIAANGQIGWKLGGDDAQFVAYRTADIFNMDFDWSDVLRIRLNRVIIATQPTAPALDQGFRDQVAQITFYLVELTGVV